MRYDLCYALYTLPTAIFRRTHGMQSSPSSSAYISMIMDVPMPPPMHSVAKPYFASLFFIS